MCLTPEIYLLIITSHRLQEALCPRMIETIRHPSAYLTRVVHDATPFLCYRRRYAGLDQQ